MIWNVVDRRKRHHRWKRITGIIEPTYHDNSVSDSDQLEEPPEAGFSPYDAIAETCLADAVIWAQAKRYPVTLFLYDLGDGIK